MCDLVYTEVLKKVQDHPDAFSSNYIFVNRMIPKNEVVGKDVRRTVQKIGIFNSSKAGQPASQPARQPASQPASSQQPANSQPAFGVLVQKTQRTPSRTRLVECIPDFVFIGFDICDYGSDIKQDIEQTQVVSDFLHEERLGNSQG